jgi:hypothetical protein
MTLNQLVRRALAHNLVVTKSESDDWFYSEYTRLKKRLTRSERRAVLKAIANGERFARIQNGYIENIAFV